MHDDGDGWMCAGDREGIIKRRLGEAAERLQQVWLFWMLSLFHEILAALFSKLVKSLGEQRNRAEVVHTAAGRS